MTKKNGKRKKRREVITGGKIVINIDADSKLPVRMTEVSAVYLNHNF